MEAWQKVFIDKDFFNSTHGRKNCVSCHGGQGGYQTMANAHQGVIANPSNFAEEKCGLCHEEIAATHRTSLHATQEGYFTSFAVRTGEARPSANVQAMFEKQCASCHASCGQCHVSRPISVKGGVVSGHVFRRRPSMTENCIACHGSRIGEEFRGDHAGIPADAHYLKGMNCFSCHPKAELHGDGTTAKDRYDSALGYKCETCHPDAVSPNSNVIYHKLHGSKVQCQVCHSVPYKNCYSCHVGREEKGLRRKSQLDFRIARNVLKSAERPYNVALVRHVPIAPDSYSEWGITLPNFAAAPTWRYTSPHNIQPKTPQTASCNACHTKGGLFLTQAYLDSLLATGVLFPEELEANREVVMPRVP